MDLPDVSVLVQAFRTDGAFHEPAARWLEAVARVPLSACVTPHILSSLIRIETHPGSAKLPARKPEVLDFAGSS